MGYISIVTLRKTNEEDSTKIYVTDLLNYAMPLINYEIGDEVMMNDNLNIGYVYNGQIINNILGRSSDIITLENGRVLTGPGFTVLFKDIPVEYYCIEKVSSDKIKVYINKTVQFKPIHLERIKSSLKHQAGEEIDIQIEFSEEIRLTKNGKRQYFINLLDP